MKFLESMIAWNPVWLNGHKSRKANTRPGAISVGSWPDKSRWSTAYDFTDGACMLSFHEMNRDQQERMLFIIFNTLTVRDGVDPIQAHKEFMKIEEYAASISPDIEQSLLRKES